MGINTYIIHKKELKSQCLSENMQFFLIPGKLQTALLLLHEKPILLHDGGKREQGRW